MTKKISKQVKASYKLLGQNFDSESQTKTLIQNFSNSSSRIFQHDDSQDYTEEHFKKICPSETELFKMEDNSRSDQINIQLLKYQLNTLGQNKIEEENQIFQKSVCPNFQDSQDTLMQEEILSSNQQQQWYKMEQETKSENVISKDSKKVDYNVKQKYDLNQLVQDFCLQKNGFLNQFLPENHLKENFLQLKPNSKHLLINFNHVTRTKKNISQQKGYQRFANKNKQLMTKILQFISCNIRYFNLPEPLLQHMELIIKRIRESGRNIMEKRVQRSDSFSHSHYNVLFLAINQISLEELLQSQRDLELHRKIYGLDLLNCVNQMDSKINDQLETINFVKRCFYIIVSNYLQPMLMNPITARDQDIETEKQVLYEKQYSERAFSSIEKMKQGIFVKRF